MMTHLSIDEQLPIRSRIKPPNQIFSQWPQEPLNEDLYEYWDSEVRPELINDIDEDLDCELICELVNDVVKEEDLLPPSSTPLSLLSPLTPKILSCSPYFLILSRDNILDLLYETQNQNQTNQDVVNSLRNEILELISILNEEVELNKSIDGIENILEILLSNEEVLERDYCRRIVSRLYNTMLNSNGTPSTFFAKLITSMIVVSRLEDAIHFTKLFNIPPKAFTGSLRYISEKKSLELIENLANLIEKVYYHDLKPKRRRKSYESEPELGGQMQIVAPDSFFYLARIWKRESILDNFLLKTQNYDYKGKKSMKRYAINVHELKALSNVMINIWSREMEECLDITSSLKILCYAERNEIQLDQIVVDRCRRTYIETGTNKLELEEKLARINIAPNI